MTGDAETLRQLVREVLAELLPREAGSGAGVAAPPGPGYPATAGPASAYQGGAGQPGLPVTEFAESVEVVALRTDADLTSFVLRLLHLFENPKHRDDLRSGRLRFRLAAAAVPG